jgi:hypothetical protein
MAIGDFIMSTKSKAPKTTKTIAKPVSPAKRAKAVAAAQAADAAANAKSTKTTIDAGGGILVDVVEPKTTKNAKAPKEPKVKKISGLDAAAQVLKDKGEPMTCKDIVETMLAKGMWKTDGKTPAATIYSAMLREIDNKPAESRFTKTGRGLFALATPKKA